MYDAIIVGGGPAGLSAALILGRCRRRILVVDAGRPRNAAATHAHGFLTRDHIEPAEFLRLGREQLATYGVEFRAAEATDAARRPPGFRITLDTGESLDSRKLLLATGLRDILPDIPGLRPLYGRGVHHCPYCDGWEHRDQLLAALGPGAAAIGLALSLKTWSSKVTACTQGQPVPDDQLHRAARCGVAVRTQPIERLAARDGKLESIIFVSGPPLPCTGLFFNTPQVQRSPLASRLGCAFKPDGGVLSSDRQCTDVPGLYIAGDADKDVQFLIVAAAEGATAAVAINRELQDEDRGERPKQKLAEPAAHDD